MAESDPRKYRGGVQEPDDAKGEGTWADNEGVVPREMVDEPEGPPPERAGDDQALADESLGDVTDRDETVDIDRSGGDEADATSHSGTGGNVAEVKEQMQEGEAAPWPQAANVARETTDEDENAQA